jgi:hypothetical protein
VEYRSRPGQKGPGTKLKVHEFGVGQHSDNPLVHKSITQHVDAWRWFYDSLDESRGRGEGQNPAHSLLLSKVLHVIGKVLGRARVVMIDPLEP